MPVQASRCREHMSHVDFEPTDFGSTYTVLTGPDLRPLFAHEEVLRYQSDYFKAACSEASKSKVVIIEGVELATMNVYVRWKYTRRLTMTPNDWLYETEVGVEDESSDEEEDDVMTEDFVDKHALALSEDCDDTDFAIPEMRALLRLYVACHLFLDDVAKNVVMTYLMKLDDECDLIILQSEEFIRYIWEHTSAGSRLRDYLLDVCLVKMTAGPPKDVPSYPFGFMTALEVLRRDVRNGRAEQLCTKKASPCSYHDHGKVSELWFSRFDKTG
ncbi:hypothetical protein LTR15_012945 [Elasticomyces elasticus]|nr:hypothetical protein LTR15_012945 [Elasticomyces elasticus]